MFGQEWRKNLEEAVAHRMHFRAPMNTTREEAQLQVQDFVKYGAQSEYAGPVMAAAFELFSGDVQILMPVIKAAVTQITETVQREIETGRDVESKLR